MRLINSSWPVLHRKNFSVLLADDNQLPLGRERFLRNPFSKSIGYLSEMERPECFVQKKHQYMLAEMIGMSLTDYHMGMPLSSCDDIVVHWRRARGKPEGSSYPGYCYDRFYTDKNVGGW